MNHDKTTQKKTNKLSTVHVTCPVLSIRREEVSGKDRKGIIISIIIDDEESDDDDE